MVGPSNQSSRAPGWGGRCYRAALSRHYRHWVPEEASVLEIGCGGGELLALLANRDVTGVDPDEGQLARARERLPHATLVHASGETLRLDRTFDFIIVSDTLIEVDDVEAVLSRLQSCAHERTRLIVNFHNHVWRPVLGLASICGWRAGPPRPNWLASDDVVNLAWLADWQPVRRTGAILCPVKAAGLDRLANRFVAPWVPAFCLSIFVVARPLRRRAAAAAPSVSVIVPARNEAGTIGEVVRRVPAMGSNTEIVFVEGGSSDGTWERILAVKAANPGAALRCVRQTGTGKANAVREGVAAASGDIVIVCDADLSTPPEELPKFYEALASNRAEFANGSRLVYPREKGAMPFAHMCVNKAFALSFRWILGQPVKDTLCGTKAFWRLDYARILAERRVFGDFDPFGDFELLFGASKLGLRIADIPVHYRERTYGRSNILRWRHGWLLLRMAGFAAWKMKFIG